MHKALRRALVSLTAVPAVTVAAAAALAVPAGAAAAHGAAAAAVKPGTAGPKMYSRFEAGYAATKNSFRFVKADFTLPDPTTFHRYLSRVEYTTEFWSASRDTVLGVYASTANTSAKPWHIEAKIYNNKTHALICATSSAKHPCPGVAAGSHWSATYKIGDDMQVTSLFNQGSGTVRFNMADLTTAVSSNDAYHAGTAIFGQARIAAEFGCSPWTACGKGLTYTAPAKPLLVMQANDCELSVMKNGLIGFAGPFVHSKVIMTSNGTSSGTRMAYPEHLSQNLNGFHSDFPLGEFDVALP